jgi:short-subunit dehydrogenase
VRVSLGRWESFIDRLPEQNRRPAEVDNPDGSGGEAVAVCGDSCWVPQLMTTNANVSTARPLAAVTGASSGIGYEIALELARRGYDLVINAEDADLDQATVAAKDAGADVTAVRCDLRAAESVEELYAAIKRDGRPLAVLALNAGVGQGGPFVDNYIEDEVALIDLNITSTVRLAKLVLRDMVAADAGRVLVTSSIASEMPGSFQAVYNASKSFVQSFTEALQNELKDTSVTLTSLMPGPTETEFFERANMLDTKVGQAQKDDAATVAQQGVEALLAGKPRVTGGGLKTRAQDLVSKVVPDKVKAATHRAMAEPGSAG